MTPSQARETRGDASGPTRVMNTAVLGKKPPAEERGEGAVGRRFSGSRGGSEHFIAVSADPGLCLDEQIALVQRRYTDARKARGLAPETAIFRRIFVSDALNQIAAVRESSLVREPSGSPVAVSIVQQPPLPGAKIALLAYHLDDPGRIVKRRLSGRHLLVEKNGRRHLWSTRLCAGADSPTASVDAQTREVLTNLIDVLAGQGATLRDNCIRTWIFLKNIDVFYRSMADSRRELFRAEGLTQDSHYIASTGIEGACAHQFDLVAMDAYSALDLAPGQVSYLNDFDRLCPTKDYNVTFERGTRIAYADRTHHFISGTASIDGMGQIVHTGNVIRQLDHALDNVDALLRAGASRLAEMMYLIVYLRDPADYARVDAHLARRLPGLPVLTVQAAVCRPGWLVEVEGVAVAANDDPALPPF